MSSENNGFFFSFVREIVLLFKHFFCFFVGKKIKIKGMLVQNLYENILIRQKLKTKQGNHIINSID